MPRRTSFLLQSSRPQALSLHRCSVSRRTCLPRTPSFDGVAGGQGASRRRARVHRRRPRPEVHARRSLRRADRCGAAQPRTRSTSCSSQRTSNPRARNPRNARACNARAHNQRARTRARCLEAQLRRSHGHTSPHTHLREGALSLSRGGECESVRAHLRLKAG
eukprot:6139535-Pleurochrysis_carterae.AAC.5